VGRAIWFRVMWRGPTSSEDDLRGGQPRGTTVIVSARCFFRITRYKYRQLDAHLGKAGLACRRVLRAGSALVVALMRQARYFNLRGCGTWSARCDS